MSKVQPDSEWQFVRLFPILSVKKRKGKKTKTQIYVTFAVWHGGKCHLHFALLFKVESEIVTFTCKEGEL